MVAKVAGTTASTETLLSPNLSRIPPARKIVNGIIKRVTLEVHSIHIHSLTSDSLHATVNLKLSQTGPLHAKVYLPSGAEMWTLPSSQASKSAGKKKSTDGDSKGTFVSKVHIDAFHIHPTTRRSVPIPLSLRLSIPPTSEPSGASTSRSPDAATLSKFVRAILLGEEPLRIAIRSSVASVKAYGFRFGRLHFDKTLSLPTLQGLGSLYDPRARSVSQKPGAERLRVTDLVLLGGDPVQGVSFQCDVELRNPSTLTLEVGQLQFEVCVPFGGDATEGATGEAPIGSLLLPAVPIKPGANILHATGSLLIPPAPAESSPATSESARAHAAGMNLVRALLEDRDVPLSARALEGSATTTSDIPWLNAALSGTRIDAVLPRMGARSKILDSAEVQTPSADSAKGGGDTATPPGGMIARARLRNGLGADLKVHSLQVRAVSESPLAADGAARTDDTAPLELGTIQTAADWSGMTIPAGPVGGKDGAAKGEEVKASLPFALNADTGALIEMLRRSAFTRGVSLGEGLEEVFDLLPASANINGHSHQRTQHSTASQSALASASGEDPSSDLPLLISRALNSLSVTAHVSVQASLGSYPLPGLLSFTQEHLPIAISPSTASAIIPRVGGPLVDALIGKARILVEALDITSLDEHGVEATAKLGLFDFGPLTASVDLASGAELSIKREAAGQVADAGAWDEVAIFRTLDPIEAVPGRSEAMPTKIRITALESSSVPFSTLVARLLSDATVSVRLHTPSVSVTTGGVTFRAPLTKIIELQGFGGFKDVRAKDFKILGQGRAPRIGSNLQAALHASSSVIRGTKADSGDADDAIRVAVSVELINKGSTSVRVARAEFSLEFEGHEIGVLGTDQLLLQATSTSTVELKGMIFLRSRAEVGVQKHEATLKAIGTLVTHLIAGEEVHVTVRGSRGWPYSAGNTETPAPSVQSLPWLDTALHAFQTVASIKEPALLVVERIDIGSLNAILPDSSPPRVEVSDVTAEYAIPYPLDMRIEACKVDVDVTFDDRVVGSARVEGDMLLESDVDRGRTESEAKAKAKAKAANGSAKPSQNGKLQETSMAKGASGKLKMDLKEFVLPLDDEETFSQMIAHVADCEETDRIGCAGDVDATIATVVGKLEVRVKLGKAHRLIVRGVQSMRTSPVQYTDLRVIGAEEKFLLITFSLFLNNPSQSVSLLLPDSGLEMAAYYQGTYVGRAYVGKGSFRLDKGPCAFHNVEFRYEPSPNEEKSVRQLAANFLTGKVTRLQIRGDDASTRVPSLRPALRNIALEFDLQPFIHSTLIDSITATLGLQVLTSMIEATYVINNPLGVPLTLCAMSFMASYRGEPFGSSSFSLDTPLIVAAGTPSEPGKGAGKPIKVTLAQPLDRIVKTYLKEKGSIFLDVEATARIEVQGFKIPVVEYKQRLPLTINGLGGLSKMLWALPG